MDVSAREAARSATEKPDDHEDNEDKDAVAVKDGRTSKIAELLKPFFSLWGKVSLGGSSGLLNR